MKDVAMTRILRYLTKALGLLGVVAFAGMANAGPIGVTNANVTIWHYDNGGGAIGDPCEQALATNPCAVAGNQVYSGLYTGQINFTNPAANTIASFLNTAGGTFVGGIGGLTQMLSSGGFSISTLINFVFTINAESFGQISHDDGISIYDGTNTSLLIDSSYPTVVTNTAFHLMPGTYSLWYSEVNGLPAQLIMDVQRTVAQVPEPASLALLAIGLLGLGFSRRKQ
jgi:hypothetical protein